VINKHSRERFFKRKGSHVESQLLVFQFEMLVKKQLLSNLQEKVNGKLEDCSRTGWTW
jgi:hypothetical protein